MPFEPASAPPARVDLAGRHRASPRRPRPDGTARDRIHEHEQRAQALCRAVWRRADPPRRAAGACPARPLSRPGRCWGLGPAPTCPILSPPTSGPVKRAQRATPPGVDRPRAAGQGASRRRSRRTLTAGRPSPGVVRTGTAGGHDHGHQEPSMCRQRASASDGRERGLGGWRSVSSSRGRRPSRPLRSRSGRRPHGENAPPGLRPIGAPERLERQRQRQRRHRGGEQVSAQLGRPLAGLGRLPGSAL